MGVYRSGAPMDRVATDLLGPFPVTYSKNRYILVVMDTFTKWVEAYAIPEFSAKTVAKKIVYEFISRFGAPLELHSDQGRNYEAQLFKDICEMLEIHKTRTSPYHPSSNGMVERFNKTLLNMLSAYTDDKQRNWDEDLPLLTAAYRSCEHDSTGYTPNRLMLGREVHLPVHLAMGASPKASSHESWDAYVHELNDEMSAIHAFARKHLESATRRQKKDYDSRAHLKRYQEDDLVYFRDDTKVIGLNPKLKNRRWAGPAVIVRKISDLLYEVKVSEKKSKILHHDRLKEYLSDDVPEWIKKFRRAKAAKEKKKSQDPKSKSA